MIPYICSELPPAQKEALSQLVKMPLVYTSVAISNWRAFKTLGVAENLLPRAYFSSVAAQLADGYRRLQKRSIAR